MFDSAEDRNSIDELLKQSEAALTPKFNVSPKRKRIKLRRISDVGASSSSSSSAPSAIIVERRFPGPAGLLLPIATTRTTTAAAKTTATQMAKSNEIPVSQATSEIFNGCQWMALLEDFHDFRETLINHYTIDWIHRNSRFYQQKAPFLAAIIRNVEYFHGQCLPVINVNLKDPTGEINATVVSSVYEQYGQYFTVGTVLLLKLFSVLHVTTSVTNTKYITITPKNLIGMYVKRATDEKPIKITHCDITAGHLLEMCVNLPQNPTGKFRRNTTTKGHQNSSPPMNKDTIGNCESLEESTELWRNVLNGIDADTLFDDF